MNPATLSETYTPRLIFLGSSLLSTLAGYINTVFLSLFLLPVSHITGTVSRFSLDLASMNSSDGIKVLLVIVGFFTGAVVTGLIIGGGQVRFGRRYGAILMLEGLFLSGSSLIITQEVHTALMLAAIACGLQNAMASSYRGMIVRTTHLTGNLTDLGILVGRALRQYDVSTWQATLLLATFLSFLLGGLLGAFASTAIGKAALWGSALYSFSLGLAYYLWRHRAAASSDV